MEGRSVDQIVVRMGAILNDRNRALKTRFRALFALRNLGGQEAIQQIGRCFDDQSALLKHELAYCLGQMRDADALGIVTRVLTDVEGHEAIVRHEAGRSSLFELLLHLSRPKINLRRRRCSAEALGAIGSGDSVSVLEEHLKDESVPVSETCQLAIRRIQWANDPLSAREDVSANPYKSTGLLLHQQSIFIVLQQRLCYSV